MDLRTFIKQFIENGGTVLDETLIQNIVKDEKTKDESFDSLDETSQKIINILEEYVKPAVAADGGNIVFDSSPPLACLDLIQRGETPPQLLPVLLVDQLPFLIFSFQYSTRGKPHQKLHLS